MGLCAVGANQHLQELWECDRLIADRDLEFGSVDDCAYSNPVWIVRLGFQVSRALQALRFDPFLDPYKGSFGNGFQVRVQVPSALVILGQGPEPGRRLASFQPRHGRAARPRRGPVANVALSLHWSQCLSRANPQTLAPH